MKTISRRDFLKAAVLGAAALALPRYARVAEALSAPAAAHDAQPDVAQNLRGVILFKLFATAQYGTCHRWSACQKCCRARGSVSR